MSAYYGPGSVAADRASALGKVMGLLAIASVFTAAGAVVVDILNLFLALLSLLTAIRGDDR